MSQQDMVIKRNGDKEIFSFDKILKRVTTLGKSDLHINYTSLVQKIIDRLYDGIPYRTLIDELTAQQCASLITTHYDYGTLASRILISNHHKNTLNRITKKWYRNAISIYRYTWKSDLHLVNKEILRYCNGNARNFSRIIRLRPRLFIQLFWF